MKTFALAFLSVIFISMAFSYPDRLFRNNDERISLRKCREYKDLIAEYKQINICSLWSAPCYKDTKIYNCESFTGLIVGGVKTKPGEFPHMAAIGWRENDGGISFKCGGSLISEKFILTVAHCAKGVNGEPPQTARLGDQNLGELDDGAMPVDYKISKFIKHENYDPKSKHHDVGLIELEKTVQFSKFIRPACLKQDYVKSFTSVVATGWGQTGTFSSTSDDLMKVPLKSTPNSRCKSDLEDEEIDIFPEQICAGGERGKDTCRGDSGGPIQISHSDVSCVYDIVGMTSHGVFVCGSSLPAVYTRVSNYLDWIEENVWL